MTAADVLSFVKKNLLWLAVAAAVLIGGWLVYEKITANLRSRAADRVIATLRSDGAKLRAGLTIAEERVVASQATIEQLRQTGEQLNASLKRSESQRGQLSADNQRLRDILERGAASGASAGAASAELGTSIDRAIEIAGRLENPCGTK